MKVLVTGAAGFIGYHVCQRLLQTGKAEVLGVDSLNSYYSVGLKRARLGELEKVEGFRFLQGDLSEQAFVFQTFEHFKPDYVVHLAAQAGVRYSAENPAAYVQSNLVGHANILEAARRLPPRHLVFASSSSVYGQGAQVPFLEDALLGKPMSFYAATKQANEAMSFAYARAHDLTITGLRFFTAYGPWGRPDMTPLIFAKAICEGKPLRLYNQGNYKRDFTYIADISEGVVRALLYPPSEQVSPPYRIFNLGHGQPVEMLQFVRLLETALCRKARIELLPPLATEMEATCADISRAQRAFAYKPRTSLEEGVPLLVEWYKAHDTLLQDS